MKWRFPRPVDALKIAWISLWAVVMSLVLFIPVTAAALLSTTGNLAFTLSKIWAHAMLKVTGVKVVIRGREKIVPGTPYVIISNHQSEYDIFAVVTSLRIQFRWIIKMELRHVPLFGYALYASRNIFIDRRDHEQAVKSIRLGTGRLPPGCSVIFFAEGTRSPDGTIREFKKGGFSLALERGFEILPVTVNGSRRIMPKGSLVFTPGVIEVVVGDPIDVLSYTRENIQDLMDRTRGVVVSNFLPDYPG
jgi:1-acyl-sn-glycerol-3-phosphate acyltransferase